MKNFISWTIFFQYEKWRLALKRDIFSYVYTRLAGLLIAPKTTIPFDMNKDFSIWKRHFDCCNEV